MFGLVETLMMRLQRWRLIRLSGMTLGAGSRGRGVAGSRGRAGGGGSSLAAKTVGWGGSGRLKNGALVAPAARIRMLHLLVKE